MVYSHVQDTEISERYRLKKECKKKIKNYLKH